MLGVLTSNRFEEAPVSESYEGRQFVGMDLHRRRSVLVRMTETGERLETVRISNDPEYLRQVMARAGETPGGGAGGHLRLVLGGGHAGRAGRDRAPGAPVGGEGFRLRRVKNDERDAADLADLLRMGRLPEAWIAPPATRELRGWVRHRAKLVGLRSNLKCQVHAMLAAAGVHGADERPVRAVGQQLLAAVRLAPESRARVDSLLRLIDAFDFEIELFAKLVAGRLAPTPATWRSRPSPGWGRCLPRCSSPRSATSPGSAGPRSCPRWAGMTPQHRESDTTVHRGRITKQGNLWCAGPRSRPCNASARTVRAVRDQVGARRGRNIGKVAAARELTLVFYGLRDGHIRRPRPVFLAGHTRGMSSLPDRGERGSWRS